MVFIANFAFNFHSGISITGQGKPSVRIASLHKIYSPYQDINLLFRLYISSLASLYILSYLGDMLANQGYSLEYGKYLSLGTRLYKELLVIFFWQKIFLSIGMCICMAIRSCNFASHGAIKSQQLQSNNQATLSVFLKNSLSKATCII